MSWWGSFGGGASSGAAGGGTVGMTGMSGTTESVPVQGSGAEGTSKLKDFAKQAGEQLAKGGSPSGGKGGGGDPGSGSTLAAKREIGTHPEATHLEPAPARQGFSRLAELGPRQPKVYGSP